MHAPAHFRVDDQADLAAFIEGRHFGMLIVAGENGPQAAHIPMLLNRDALHGLMAQMQVGEGAEFEALADYRQGLDRRAIDWKQSARHTHLIAKEYE